MRTRGRRAHATGSAIRRSARSQLPWSLAPLECARRSPRHTRALRYPGRARARERCIFSRLHFRGPVFPSERLDLAHCLQAFRRMIASTRFGLVVQFGLLISACTHAAPPSATTATSPPKSIVQAALKEPAEKGRGHEIVIQATSCWLGGLWSDAVGEKGDARDAGIRRRCDDVLRRTGESPENAYYPLRALDPATVAHLADDVRRTAAGDPKDAPYAEDLVALLRNVADVSRETVHARRAADTVKQAIEASPSAEERRSTKVAAAPALRTSLALRRILPQGGPYAEEAHLIGMLHALDRMEIASGLPMHLKVYAVQGAYLDLFGVSPPHLSRDAALPIRAGTWLTYLTDVASAAGHPVPADAKNPQNREPLAWNGVLEGFADRLRNAKADSPLGLVIRNVVARIDRQAAEERAQYEAHSPEDR